MASHNDLGKEAEEMAVRYLSDKGHEILERNFRFQKLELDIISRIGDLLVITEVKARSETDLIKPYQAVGISKKRRVLQAADHYAVENEVENEIRFDIISITKKKEGRFDIEHIEDAFEAFSIE